MNTTARMNHIFNTDGKTFIMAMDHAANFNTLPALQDPKKLERLQQQEQMLSFLQ